MLGPYIGIAMDQEKINDIAILVNVINFLDLEISPLTFIGISMILIFGFRLVFAVLINKKILNFCRDIQVGLRSDLMMTYQNMAYDEFIEMDSSDAIANTTVLSMYFTNNVLYMSLKAFAEVILALFLFSFLVSVNGLLVLILSFGLGFLVLIYSNFFKSTMILYGKKINEANANLVQAVKQSMDGIKEVRVLGKESFFYDRYITNAQTYGELHAKSLLINTGSRYFIEFSIMGFFVLTISASEILVSEDSSEIFATLAMFGFAAIRLLPGVNILSSTILQLRAQKNTVDRLFKTINGLNLNINPNEIDYDLYNAENKNIEKEKIPTFKSIKLKNISYSYPNSKTNVLNDINLELRKGESIGVIGPSGSGKTSLIDIILGLLKPVNGEIILNGKPLDKIKNEWIKMLAYIPQESLMINAALSSNIKLAEVCESDANNDLIQNSIAQAQLSKVVDNLPDGIFTNVGESGVRFSGGQRQRIALARAIFHSRDVLVFDEATSALDSETEAEVVNEITRMKGLKTMIVVAHRTNTLRFCDRIYKIDNGSIVEVGTPDQILGNL